MRILQSSACVIAIVLLITGCADNNEFSGKPNDPKSAVANQPPDPVNPGTDSGEDPVDTERVGINDEEQKPDGEQELYANVDGSAGQLYGLAFEAMMPMDEALNENMKYIAIDFSVLSHLTEEDKQYIEQYMGKFAVEVKDATFEQLEESENLRDNNMILDGVLLKVDKVDISENGAVIEGIKYRSGNGAIGVNIKLTLEDGAWKVAETATTWIS